MFSGISKKVIFFSFLFINLLQPSKSADFKKINENTNIQKYNHNKSLFLEIDLKNSSAKSKDFNFNLEIKESTKKMFLSGEWDATTTLLENSSLVERKFKELPYVGFI